VLFFFLGVLASVAGSANGRGPPLRSRGQVSFASASDASHSMGVLYFTRRGWDGERSMMVQAGGVGL